MRKIMEIVAGSHLYGTNTPDSDTDVKSIFLPNRREILLQRVPSVIVGKRDKKAGERNTSEDVDTENFSLQKFFEMVCEGQTLALDLLFAPMDKFSICTEDWITIVHNRHRLVTRKSESFVGYCRTQANKYGIKGSRVSVAKKALAVLKEGLDRLGTTAKLRDLAAEVAAAANEEFSAIIEISQNKDAAPVKHWEVCGRKLPFTTTIKMSYEIIENLVDTYGKRALAAEDAGGVDWKALSHAVRVGTEAIELLSTGKVTLPLPNRELLLDIKLGKLPYNEVAAQIESLLDEVEAASAASILPVEVDRNWIDDFVVRAYGEEVMR